MGACPPPSIPDWLALVGDSADGIPGIPGWGAKSAAAVLSRFGHLEHVPDEFDAWPANVRGAKRLAESLSQHYDEVQLYRTLATLRTDVPIEEDLEDLEWRGADRDKLEALCERIGDGSPLEAVPRFQS